MKEVSDIAQGRFSLCFTQNKNENVFQKRTRKTNNFFLIITKPNNYMTVYFLSPYLRHFKTTQ